MKTDHNSRYCTSKLYMEILRYWPHVMINLAPTNARQHSATMATPILAFVSLSSATGNCYKDFKDRAGP